VSQFCPAGRCTFTPPFTGKPTRSENESLPRQIRIEKGFYLGKFEITVRQYQCFVQNYRHPLGYALDDAHKDTYPAAVTWEQADAFCKWLQKQTKRTVRLPNEIEWEYACRSQTTTRFFWGEKEEDAGKYANVADDSYDRKYPKQLYCFPVNDGYSGPAPAGKFLPNGFGLYDMIGNLPEWCSDAYEFVEDETKPSTDDKVWRVVRGGGYTATVATARCASRANSRQDDKDSLIGFRIVVESE
jgi:sulfatase modifying factor 1